LLAPAASGAPRRLNGDLKSTYEVIDSAGKSVRQIVVPGIIVKVDRPVVLTPNTALCNLSVPEGLAAVPH